MSIFARTHYVSEATQFIDSLKSADPQLESRQLAGRALLWDKPLTQEQATRTRSVAHPAELAQKAYPYQTR